MKRSLACLVASALIWTCPGLAAYAAAGEISAVPGVSVSRGAPVALPSLPVSAPGALTLPSAGLEAGLSEAAAALPVGPSAAALPQAAVPAARPQAAVPAARQALTAGAARLQSAGGDSERQSALGQIYAGERAVSISFESAPTPSGALEASGLVPSDALRTREGSRPPTPPGSRGPNAPAPQGPRGSKFIGFLTSLGRVALGGGAVVGLQALAVHVLPAIFGLSPVAAVWAVSSGVLMLPAALYSRYLLSKHDSPRLRSSKSLLDWSIGALIGAGTLASHAFAAALAAHALSFAPLLLVAGAGSLLAMVSGGKLLDFTLSGGAMLALPAFVAVVGSGAIGLAPLLGMMAIPVMTTLSFFLGSIVKSAETGEPFSVPGTLQKMRFPSFTWVMTGVVFALLSGYSAFHPNIAFFVWQIFGSRSVSGAPGKDGKPAPAWKRLLSKVMNFDVMFLGLLAFTAATGFTSPATFLVLAFAPERAAVWAERLLSRFLPKSAAAPSTKSREENDGSSWAAAVEKRAPNFHHWLRTGILLGTMLAMGWTMGALVFGMHSLLKNLAIGAVMAAIPYFLSDKLVVAMMKAKPTDEAHDPEFFGIMKDLRERINDKRAAKGQKPIPMPSMVNVPMDAPNAFATGRDPFHAVVGVTQGIKAMLLDPENLRQELVVLMASVDPASKSYKVFRRAIAGSIPGVGESSSPQEVSQALMRAAPERLKALGVRLLRGVLGHEFSHVMDRHMLVGSVAGGISTGVSFASYGVMWGVGHAQVAAKRLKQAVFGGARAQSRPSDSSKDLGGGARTDGAKPEALEPISAAIALKSLPALLRMFAALWGPIILQITQMAGSRNNEAQADEDGAYLTGDPEALALSLGLLMTWKPKQGFLFSFNRLPGLAATAHMFTVNPLQQLQQAGAMPKADAASQWVLGKNDNWMMNLFITHPDTRWRIETLGDIARGMSRR